MKYQNSYEDEEEIDKLLRELNIKLPKVKDRNKNLEDQFLLDEDYDES